MPRKRRSKGSGSVRKRGSRWQARFTPPSGTEITQTFSRKSAAEDWLALQRSDVKGGTFIEPSDLTLGEWIDEWTKTYKSGGATSSQESYGYSLARLEKHTPALLALPIQTIEAIHLQQAVNVLNGLYSARTVRLTIGMVTAAINSAKEQSIIKRAPTSAIELPVNVTIDGGQLIPPADFRAIIETCKQKPADPRAQVYRDIILFLARHGCRPGEARAIRCDKVSDGWIVIDAALDQHQVLKDTKTHVKRVIPIAVDCLDMIRHRRAASKSGWLFESSTGSPLWHRNLARHFKAMTSGEYSPYDLRHTFCSMAVKAGGNLKAISTITGHSIEMLLKVYVHVDDADLKAIVNLHTGQILDRTTETPKCFTNQNARYIAVSGVSRGEP